MQGAGGGRSLRVWSRVLVLTAVCSLGACATETSLPEEYLGTWYYMGSSGGISGDGMGDAATGYIVITADNTIESYEDDGTHVGTASFTPERGQTIMSADPMWMMKGDGGFDRIFVLGDGALAISDNVYDGFQLDYARSR